MWICAPTQWALFRSLVHVGCVVCLCVPPFCFNFYFFLTLLLISKFKFVSLCEKLHVWGNHALQFILRNGSDGFNFYNSLSNRLPGFVWTQAERQRVVKLPSCMVLFWLLVRIHLSHTHAHIQISVSWLLCNSWIHLYVCFLSPSVVQIFIYANRRVGVACVVVAKEPEKNNRSLSMYWCHTEYFKEHASIHTCNALVYSSLKTTSLSTSKQNYRLYLCKINAHSITVETTDNLLCWKHKTYWKTT